MKNMHKVVNWVLFTAIYWQKMKRLSAAKVICELFTFFRGIAKITTGLRLQNTCFKKEYLLYKRFKTWELLFIHLYINLTKLSWLLNSHNDASYLTNVKMLRHCCSHSNSKQAACIYISTISKGLEGFEYVINVWEFKRTLVTDIARIATQMKSKLPHKQ
jgi:hypothetical protein